MVSASPRERRSMGLVLTLLRFISWCAYWVHIQGGYSSFEDSAGNSTLGYSSCSRAAEEPIATAHIKQGLTE